MKDSYKQLYCFHLHFRNGTPVSEKLTLTVEMIRCDNVGQKSRTNLRIGLN